MRNNYPMSSNLLVYKKQTSSESICKYFNEICDVDIVEISNLNQNLNYENIIVTHRDTPNIIKLIKQLDDPRLIFVTQKQHSGIPFKTAAVGFSEYLFTPSYDYFIPTYSLRSFPKEVSTPKIGYYTKMIGSPEDKKLYQKYLLEFGCDSVNLLDTKNPKTFFEQITHFLYLYSTNFDGMPNTLCEAVNSNKQIIIPNRKIKRDGGYDFASNCNYHTNFNDTILDNSDNIFIKDNFLKVFEALIDNNFRLSFDRNKYYNIERWIYDL